MTRATLLVVGVLVLAAGIAVCISPLWASELAGITMTEADALPAAQVGGAVSVLGGLLTLLGLYSRRA